MTHLRFAWPFLFVLASPAVVLAQTERRSEEPVPETDPVLEHVRFEGTMGFLGGWARYADTGLSGTPALPPSAFEGGAAAGAPVAGLRYDLRLVVAFVRMTVGADLAWSLARPGDTTRAIDHDGTARSLVDRELFAWSLRFGLGVEATLDDRVRLFADVVGAVRFVELRASLDGQPISQGATSFVPGLRVGTRIRIVDAFFVQLAAEASPIGPWVGGELSVGGTIE